jgi:TrmH family RNA methyltransferase
MRERKMANDLPADAVRALRVEPPGLLRNIRVLLHETKDARNIGAAARAMKGMGLQHLWLVNPLCDWRGSEEARRLACNSEEVLDGAAVAATLEEASADVHLLVGTTHRRREHRMAQPVPAREAAQEIARCAQEHQVALLFGREDFGLSNDDLARCDIVASIPMATKNPSLNLAQAVQILAYEVFVTSLTPGRPVPYRLATRRDMEALFHRVERLLRLIEFRPMNDDWEAIRVPIRRVLGRSRLETRDVGVILHVCQDTEEFIRRKFRSARAREEVE